jgi:hypothetical protein
MTSEKRTPFTVITNDKYKQTPPPRENEYHTNPIEGEHANPYYQKLLEFSNRAEKKRFTVEDLLR